MPIIQFSRTLKSFKDSFINYGLSTNLDIAQKQVQLVVNNATSAQYANLLGCLFFVVFFYQGLQTETILIWGGITLLVIRLRFLSAHKMKSFLAYPNYNQLIQFSRSYLFYTFSLSILWSTLLIIGFQTSEFTRLSLVVGTFAIISAAIGTLASILPMAYGLILPLVLTLGVMITWSEDISQMSLGITVLLIIPALFYKFSKNINQTLVSSFEHAKTSEQLSQQLSCQLYDTRQLHNELNTYKDSLEDLVDTRTRILQQTNEALQVQIKETETAQALAEQANEAKSEFLANMSHELRTPMHSILSFSAFGLKKVESASQGKIIRYFSMIQESGQRLLHLLNNLLDLAKLESHHMNFDFQRHDFHEILLSGIAELQPLIEEKNLILNVPDPQIDTQFSFDAIRITQVITNLLSNAIKFSHKNGTINIDLSYSHENESSKSDGFQFRIKDGGVGIPENETSHVFDKFIQSSKTKTNAGGTGLGLAISKEIIIGHKGKIWAENSPEGGAVFYFKLPIVL